MTRLVKFLAFVVTSSRFTSNVWAGIGKRKGGKL